MEWSEIVGRSVIEKGLAKQGELEWMVVREGVGLERGEGVGLERREGAGLE